MEKSNQKLMMNKDNKNIKVTANSSKNKKQLRQSSSKNIKPLKSTSIRQSTNGQETRLKQQVSPDGPLRGRQIQNDYGVNTYYAKYKVKTNKKKENQQAFQSTDYGTFNSSRQVNNSSQFDFKNQKYIRKDEDNDYVTSAFQKLKLPNNRGVINAEGKFVTVAREKEQKNYSFHNQSASKHSFSLNFTSRDDSKYRKKNSKSKQKIRLNDKKSQDQKFNYKSADKTNSREYHSYYQKSRNQSRKSKKHKPQRMPTQQITKILGVNSKTTSIGTQTEAYSVININTDHNLIAQIKAEILKEIETIKNSVKKSKINQNSMRERTRCVNLLGKICGAMNMKRETHSLAIHYLDQYISQFNCQSMKLVTLGALTLALKMDDAQMISKFCFQYLYNPQRTVKKNSSTSHLKLKHKRDPNIRDDTREVKSKLTIILSSRISEDKKSVKEDFNLEEVLDCQTQIMVKLGFKLVNKSLAYWVDIFTASWDNYLREFWPQHQDALLFRSERNSRNFSYMLQLIQLYLYAGITGHSRVGLVMGVLYLVGRMSLQQKKEETPWEQLCRYYRASLAKSTNLIFCDGVGINPIFGDFLNRFDLGIAHIVEAVQLFSRHLQPQIIKTLEFRKVEGLNREDRLATYIYNQQLFKYIGVG